jgi:hypothetical protein
MRRSRGSKPCGAPTAGHRWPWPLHAFGSGALTARRREPADFCRTRTAQFLPSEAARGRPCHSGSVTSHWAAGRVADWRVPMDRCCRGLPTACLWALARGRPPSLGRRECVSMRLSRRSGRRGLNRACPSAAGAARGRIFHRRCWRWSALVESCRRSALERSLRRCAAPTAESAGWRGRTERRPSRRG